MLRKSLAFTIVTTLVCYARTALSQPLTQSPLTGSWETNGTLLTYNSADSSVTLATEAWFSDPEPTPCALTILGNATDLLHQDNSTNNQIDFYLQYSLTQVTLRSPTLQCEKLFADWIEYPYLNYPWIIFQDNVANNVTMIGTDSFQLETQDSLYRPAAFIFNRVIAKKNERETENTDNSLSTTTKAFIGVAAGSAIILGTIGLFHLYNRKRRQPLDEDPLLYENVALQIQN